MGQAQINVRARACSGTFIARTKQAALTHNVRGKELRTSVLNPFLICHHAMFKMESSWKIKATILALV